MKINQERAMAIHSVPIISVVIPSYNSMHTIKKCLDSVINQSINVPYEIIVVDSSDDHTPDIMESYLPIVRYFHLTQKTIPAIARNIGIDHASGEYIAFTDSDCIVDEFWLQQIMKAHQSGYDVVSGSIINALPANLISIAEYFIEFREFSLHSSRRESDFLASCNFSIKANLFHETGKFPEIRASEDMFLANNIKIKGIKILFEPKIKIKHINRSHLQPFLRNQITLGFNAAVIRRILSQPGSFLVKHPIYATLIPVVKLIRTIQIMGRNRFPYNLFQFWNFMISFPFFIIGIMAYCIGFSRGIRAPESLPAGLKQKYEKKN
jgi:glycosyltransferase involved in cell wall biosynthesis